MRFKIQYTVVAFPSFFRARHDAHQPRAAIRDQVS